MAAVSRNVASQYDAFISYSHTADHVTAESLQRSLQRLAKPWYRLRVMRIFRDETELSVAPEGWKVIESALERSRFFILLASRNSAESTWVAREVSYWLANRGNGELLIAITDGEIVWDDNERDFDREATTALPKEMFGEFESEPFWVDLRGLVSGDTLNLRNPEFRKSVAKLAAPIRGIEFERLLSEDRRQHRRVIRTAVFAAALLLMFGVFAFWQYRESQIANERARAESVLAGIARCYRLLYVNPLQAVDHATLVLDTAPESEEGELALQSAMEVAYHRMRNTEEESQVLGSGVGYLMERWREGAVFSKLRTDGQYMLVATERGKSGPDPPGDVYLVDLRNLHTVQLIAGEKASGRRLEYLGFSNSGKEVFVARQFYLDIYDLLGELKSSVELEYHAKPTHLISGLFGNYVLVGDTVGHLMLADTKSGKRPQLKGGRHGDAALSIAYNATASRAIVIFESGMATLIELSSTSSPEQHHLDVEGVVFASFSPTSRRFVTATKHGLLYVWNGFGSDVIRECSLKHASAAVMSAGFSDDEKRLISLDTNGTFRRWDMATTALISEQDIATSYDVQLTSIGQSKLSTIKEVKKLTGLPLLQAKHLVEAAPTPVLEGVPLGEARSAKRQLERIGASTSIRSRLSGETEHAEPEG